MIDKESKERAENLKNLKKGDFIWVVQLHPLFKMYSNNGVTYFGCDPNENDDYDDSTRVIKASSPLIYAPTKMAFVAKMMNDECKDDIAYVFSSDMNDFEYGDFRFGQHIILPHEHFRGYKDQSFYFDAIRFEYNSVLHMNDVFFIRQQCIEECRERNNTYQSLKKMKFISKTLNSLKKQFNDFKKSEIFVDAYKQIHKDLNDKDYE